MKCTARIAASGPSHATAPDSFSTKPCHLPNLINSNICTMALHLGMPFRLREWRYEDVMRAFLSLGPRMRLRQPAFQRSPAEHIEMSKAEHVASVCCDCLGLDHAGRPDSDARPRCLARLHDCASGVVNVLCVGGSCALSIL
jgi:hypothetical protein